ncbi:hypothetical protein BO71DRAFT_474211 [Aspergillus ellipticus CBS 707.79]|uniref:RING-type domain-containing protein n=1 Tax=Aspergillus ellipticus CBS 707.79 TaxID=1448320 RepID=A0A319EVD4_9EURO|nr:hypothetical protein BO71DRAFT_474211 [Aspergillus ellipticus CBS 707.79]
MDYRQVFEDGTALETIRARVAQENANNHARPAMSSVSGSSAGNMSTGNPAEQDPLGAVIFAQSGVQSPADILMTDAPQQAYPMPGPPSNTIHDEANTSGPGAPQQPQPTPFVYVNTGVITMPQYTPNHYYGEPSNITSHLDYHLPGRARPYPNAPAQQPQLPGLPSRNVQPATMPQLSNPTTAPVSIAPVSNAPTNSTPASSAPASSLDLNRAALDVVGHPASHWNPSTILRQSDDMARLLEAFSSESPSSPRPHSYSLSRPPGGDGQQRHQNRLPDEPTRRVRYNYAPPAPFPHLRPRPARAEDAPVAFEQAPAVQAPVGHPTADTSPTHSMGTGAHHHIHPQRMEMARRMQATQLLHQARLYTADRASQSGPPQNRGRRRQAPPSRANLDDKSNGRPDPKEPHELRANLEFLLPCGHTILCRWCADIQIPSRSYDPTRPVGHATCVVCRASVKQKVRIYLA